MLKCGIVGYGYMGEIRERVIIDNPDLELAGIAEIDPAKRQLVTRCPVFESYKQLLVQDLDIVFICTPNRFSPEICIRSLQAGKHVFCEKPPGRHVSDIEDIRMAEREGLKLMFGFNHRFHPGIMKAKMMVNSGRFGKIIALRGLYGKSGGKNFRESWRKKKEISGGGILLDQGIHMMDLFLYFCEDFEHVKCFTSDVYWKFGIEDNAFVILQNNKGQSASVHSSTTLWKHTFRLDIVLEDGYLYVEGLLSKSGSYGREKLVVARRQFEDEADAVGNPTEEVTYFDKDESWDLEVNELVRCIRDNAPVTLSSSRDALRVMQIIQQAYDDAQAHLNAEVRS